MKKLFVLLCLVFISLFSFITKNIKVKAIDMNINEDLCIVSESVLYYVNGDFIVTKVYDSNVINSVESINTYNMDSTYTKTGVSEVTRCNSNGDIIWRYVLTGYFEINPGVSCVCYNATYSQYSNSSSWTFSNGATNYSNNAAYGQGTFKYKVLFITMQTVNIDVRVMCNSNGIIS